MTEAEFLRLAEVFGSDLGRWPELVRRDAAGLLRHSAACRAAIAAEAALDGVLADFGASAAASVTPSRIASVMASVATLRDHLPPPVAWPLGRRSAGLFLVAMLLLGVGLGLIDQPATTSEGLFDRAQGEDLFGGLL